MITSIIIPYISSYNERLCQFFVLRLIRFKDCLLIKHSHHMSYRHHLLCLSDDNHQNRKRLDHMLAIDDLWDPQEFDHLRS